WGVAFRWRIRHKLMLGFLLVLGLMGLMLFGTLWGLIPCIASMKSIQSKLNEASAAEELVGSVNRLRSLDAPTFQKRLELMQEKVREAKEKLANYERQLKDTLSRRRDPEKGRREWDLIEAIGERIAALEKSLTPTENRATLGNTDAVFKKPQERIKD